MTETVQGQRLDKALSLLEPTFSRAHVQALLAQGQVWLEGEPQSGGDKKVKAGQRYRITLPEITPMVLEPQKIDFGVVFEDNAMLVVNKPAGLIVHPGAGNPDHTLVNALLAHCGESLSGIGGVARPGIVHRLDKDTSGLMVVAKNDAAHRALSAQLADRTLKRVYWALVHGVPRLREGVIHGNIGRSSKNRQKMAVLKEGGREAVTHYKVLEEFKLQDSEKNFSLIECRLQTGRTHQIRVHFQHIGHPLVGDGVYGGRKLVNNKYSTLSSRACRGIRVSTPSSNIAEQEKTVHKQRVPMPDPAMRRDDTPESLISNFPRQALHAREIGFIHPVSGKAMHFESTLPEDFTTLLAHLRGE